MKSIRKTAFMLAFVFFVGCIPNIGLTDVFASATSLLFRSEYVLSIGTNNDNPTLTNLGQPQNAWMFEWDTKVLDQDESATLQYQLEKDKRLVVTTTKKAEGNTQVDLKLVNDAGVEIPYTDKEFMIYTSQDLNFAESTKFFDTTGAANPAYNGEDDKRVLYTGTDKKQASFMLNSTSRPVGYSIKYKAYSFHFLLNKSGTFDFYQEGGFEPGRVYNADFTNTTSAGTKTTTTRKFSIGLNLEQIVTAPFVDTNSDGAPEQYAENKYSIEANNNISLIDTDQVGFEYTIQLPFEYDTTAKNFTTKAVAEKSQVVLTFGIPSDSNYFAMTVEIPKDAKGAATITSPPTFKDGGSAEVLALTGNKLTVRFTGLEEGLILTPTVGYTIIDSDVANPSLVKQLDQTTTKAYTFPKYTIVNKDGADYVSIEPFRDYAGHYVLYSATKTSDSTVNVTSLKYASAFFKEDAKSTDNVLLPLSPVPETGSKVYDYKIFFNPDVRFENPNSLLDNGISDLVKLIRSRYFEYEAKDRGNIGFPNNFTITNDNQSKMFKPKMPQYDTDGAGNYVQDFQDLSYTLAWDIGKITSIDKLIDSSTSKQIDITYVVELGDTVESKERTDFMKLTFTLDGSGGPNKAKIVGDPVAEFIGEVGGIAGAPKSVLNNIKDVRIVTDFSGQSNGYVYRLEVDIENVILDKTVEDKYLTLNSDIFFEYPDIYFMVVRPEEYIVDGTTRYFDKSNSSVIRSLTLNKDLSVKLRSPVEIETQNMVTQFTGETTPSGSIAVKDQVSFEVWYKMQAESIQNYMNYYFTNFDLTHYGQNMQFTNDIYISQNYDLMTKTIANLEKPDRIKNSTELDLSDYDFETNVNDEGVPVVMLRAFTNNTTDAPVVKTTTGTDGIDVLRNEKVLRISNIPMYEPTINEEGEYVLPTSDILDKLEINGLDTNAKYYIFVDVNVEYLADDGERRYLDNSSTKPLKESSKISALASGTTGSELQEPSILDEVPVMPDVKLVSVGRNNYSVTWDKINMDISDPTRYSQEFQYEVLRIRDTKLKDEYLDTRKDLGHVFKNEIDTKITDKSAQRLSENMSTGQPVVMAYNPATNTFVTPPANLYKQVYNKNAIIYDDNSLASNKVYFVYVRTVRVITDKTTGDVYNTYSAWDVLSATTVLGDSPIDLKVVYNYPAKYDNKTQIPLSFKAKVPNLDDIGKDITFQVTHKTGGKEWVTPITISSTQLKQSASAIDADGYRTFTFLLSDLKPGTSYSIEVRQANADGSFTPYSNIVQWKTEIDEDEYDKEDDIDAFDDLIDDLIDQLIDGSQVELENDKSDRVIMLNGNNLTNEIAGSKANTLIIGGLEKGKNNTYLIPFEAYENANNKGLAWQFSYKDMFFNLSPKTINSDYNESVLKLSRKVDRRFIEDYYMELSFDYQGNYKKLQNDDALTDVVNINMDLRATTENVLDFQQEELVATLDEVRNSDLALAKRQKVLDQIAAGMDSEDALKLVDEYVAYIQDAFQDSFNAKLKAIRQTRDDETVTKLDKSFIMGTNYQNVLSKVTAYSVTTRGVATPLTTTRSKDVSTAVVKDFGSYGFGGNVVNISGGIDNTGNTSNISNIVAENDLEDTLSNVGNVVDTTSNITVSQALQAMSNVSGMSVDETKTLLSKNGVNINRNNEDKALTQDLGVAMIGVLYENVNNVNPNKITIKDYKFYNNLKSSGINEGYIMHIQLCKEVGIINSIPSKTANVTVGDFLSMLSKV